VSAPLARVSKGCDNRVRMAPTAPDLTGYPRELEREVTLKDGARVRIRPIRADDRGRLIELYDRLSRHTAYQWFFTVMRRLPPDWAKILATVDYRRRLALAAEHEGPHGVELVGVGRYEATEREDRAEIAFVVQDGWQNRGLGTVLFRGVLDAAQARGIARFVACVLADNTRMLDLIQRFTDIEHRKMEQSVVEIVFTPRRHLANEPARKVSRTV
jgi:RimJ/RimL family protein N-acetyltransferase